MTVNSIVPILSVNSTSGFKEVATDFSSIWPIFRVNKQGLTRMQHKRITAIAPRMQAAKKSALILSFFKKIENADLVMTGNFNSKTHFLAIQATFSFKIWQKVLTKPKQIF